MTLFVEEKPEIDGVARTFLPEIEPLRKLPREYSWLDSVCDELPNLLSAGRARERISRLPELDASRLINEPDGVKERVLLALSVLGHAAVHEEVGGEPTPSVPRSVAVPWVDIAESMGRMPVLTYASHGLNNWYLFDPSGAVELGNLGILFKFFGGLDETWFVATHVEVEAKGGPILRAGLMCTLDPSFLSDEDTMVALKSVSQSIRDMNRSLLRVRERCDPDVFFNRVQPFMRGMTNVVYEGVNRYREVPQNHPGGSGAQSALLPLADAVLGVTHAEDDLISYLRSLRRYMPKEHNQILSLVERRPGFRGDARVKEFGAFRDMYNECLQELADFRNEHLKITVDYIQKPARRMSEGTRGSVGTGGSPFIAYLKKHREETYSHML